jgi:hypothetical protein
MDGRFRDAFFIDPAMAREAAEIPLTDRERTALARIRPGALAAFQRYLDVKRVGNCRRTHHGARVPSTVTTKDGTYGEGPYGSTDHRTRRPI